MTVRIDVRRWPYGADAHVLAKGVFTELERILLNHVVDYKTSDVSDRLFYLRLEKTFETRFGEVTSSWIRYLIMDPGRLSRPAHVPLSASYTMDWSIADTEWINVFPCSCAKVHEGDDVFISFTFAGTLNPVAVTQ